MVDASALGSNAHFVFESAELYIHFLDRKVIKVEWLRKGDPKNIYSIPIALGIEGTHWRRVEKGWVAASDCLKVIVGDDGRIACQNDGGETLREDFPPAWSGSHWEQRFTLQPEEMLYGLGERAAPLNLRGNSYEIWNADPDVGYKRGDDPLYLSIPVYVSQHHAGSHLVFYENSHRAEFSFGDPRTTENKDIETEEGSVWFEGGPVRYYVVCASIPEALERYSDIAGRPALPPLWALGFHQSRWGYLTSAEVREVVQGFIQHDLPLSAIHLDIDLMNGYRIFTVDPKRFADFKALTEELQSLNIRVVVIIDPGVKRDRGFDIYMEGTKSAAFCRLPGERKIAPVVWPGTCEFPDFCDPVVRDWWGRQYTRLLDVGVSGFWHDMNEPTIFSAWGESTLPMSAIHRIDDHTSNHREAHNLYGLYMAEAGDKALRKRKPESRPFILSRSGWAGLQKYAWTWTGDTGSDWEALRQTIPTVLGLGLSGIPFSGSDIGGFAGDPSPELFVRWMQLSTFLPFFRTHSSKYAPAREPWRFGEPYLSVIRDYLKLRYRLMPYIYSLAWEASQTGRPLVRPLFWIDTDDANLWGVDDAFLLGDFLLVAPILEKGSRSRMVYVPGGWWRNYWSGQLIEGPGSVEMRASLEQIPVLVRAGGMIPESDGNTLRLYLSPAQRGRFETVIYSDKGDGYGRARLDRFIVTCDGYSLQLRRESEGRFDFPYVDIQVSVLGHKIERADVDGVKLSGEMIDLDIKVFNTLDLLLSPR